MWWNEEIREELQKRETCTTGGLTANPWIIDNNKRRQ